jgi:hypothetical protein
MTLALNFFFWDWGTVPGSGSDGGSGGGGSKGGSKKDDFFPIDYDELWALREAHLRHLNDDPLKRQKELEKLARADSYAGWPDAILKPRKKR